MFTLSRRGFLETLLAGTISGAIGTTVTSGGSEVRSRKRVAMIHATDLYRPHVDPDDHWDLACVFALAHLGDVDLKAVLVDFPPRGRKDANPDVLAVSQMNFITGKNVPVATGSSISMRSRGDTQQDATLSDLGGVKMVLDILRSSTDPVIINTTGSCRDIAISGNRQPELFAEKCAGIYLNAGTSSPDKEKAEKPEYNVTLDPLAYAAIFDLPCPVYWMPCFEEMGSQAGPRTMEYGTYYRFRQDEILPHLSDRMQRFFACVLEKVTGHNWLSYLTEDGDPALIRKFYASYRNMWCTGGFLHAAGYAATSDGEIVLLEHVGDKAVFAFEPVGVTCADNGATAWSRREAGKKRYIFRVLDSERYQSAMTKAMKTLLTRLP